MTLLPKFRSKYGEVVGVELFITFPEIYNNEKTFFDADAASSAASATSNGTNFSIGQYLVLGQIGAEKTEIIKVHAATAPTSSLITFATNTVYAHNRGDLIQFIPYNQITVERSTDAGVNFTPLSAINIRPDSTETYLQRSTDASTDVYRFRFYNSADNVYSEYSDTLTASGFDDNTVYAIKNRALLDLGEKKNELITDEFLNESLNVARRELDRDKRVRRWSFRTAFNSDIGDCIPGRWSVSAPTDLRNRNTNENILSLRVGKNGRELLYQDKIRFNENYRNISHSTLNGSITTGSTSIILTSSGDFDESGTVDIAAETIGSTVDNVNYTTNTETTATLGTVTNIGENHATGRDVWQGANFGDPTAYTIVDGVIYFDIPLENGLAGENIYADYYKVLTAVNSDSDTLDEPEYDMFVNYLKWKIKYLKSNGAIKAAEDGDFFEWERKKTELIEKEETGQELRFYPDVPM